MRIYARASHINPLLFGLFSAEVWTTLLNWTRALFYKVLFKQLDDSISHISIYLQDTDLDKACYV